MSLTIRNLLRSPDVIAFSEVENLGVLQLLADKINNDTVLGGGVNPQYQAYLVEGNDVGGIDVAFLTKSSVTVNSVTQLGSSLTYTSPCTGAQELLNDRPTLRLRATANGMDFSVFANHLRSLNGIADTTPCTLSTAGARVRAKRAAQANYVAGLVQDELTANPNAKIILVGDFNAFEVNDGYVDTINTIMGTPAPSTQVLAATNDPTYPNMTNLLSLLPTAQRYSYVFDGSHQTLDHAILNPAALGQYVGGGYVRVNADFNEAGLRGNFNIPERYSDHDPGYVRLSTGADITAQLNITRTVLAFNRATGLYQMTVTLTNNTANTINGPLQLAITNLTDKATLTNASSATPGGSIYTNLPASLGPGQSASVQLTFSLPSSIPVDFTAKVFRN
jgi:predicted extracellular nuclease